MQDNQGHSPAIEAWLRLSQANGVGPVLCQKLIEHFESPEQILGASATHLCQVDGIGQKRAAGILRSGNEFNAAEELARADKQGVHVLHIQDPRYPCPLQRIHDPPPVLYVKGQITRAHGLSLAIVGSRQCSLYGQEQAARLAHLLAASGFTIVSGMARGIDAGAHQGALSAGGQTLAIQGCGLARIYPSEHKSLFHRITANGACISELPMDAEVLPEHFPARNRIIAGLSLGTLVVEAGLRSGAMITARLALENNREVLAIPGRIDSPLSRGPHKLLKQGAVLVDSINDVVDALGVIGEQLSDHVQTTMADLEHRHQKEQAMRTIQFTPSEKQIYQCLSRDPIHIDGIATQTGLGAGKVTADLVSLQLKGQVKSLPGNLFVRK
jgi:DNA processing protein